MGWLQSVACSTHLLSKTTAEGSATMPRILVRIALLAFLLSSPLVACASIQFDIGTTGPTGNHWLLGSGWGTDASEMQSNNPTLLGATFAIDSGLPSVSFPLTNVGDTFTMLFGTINFTEPNGMGGILSSETD